MVTDRLDRPGATSAPGLDQEVTYRKVSKSASSSFSQLSPVCVYSAALAASTAVTPPPLLHAQSSFSAFDFAGASGSFSNPVDLSEGSSQNPVDLSEGSQQHPFDLTEDNGGSVTDPNKGVCIGKLIGTQFTVWAKVIGRNHVGFHTNRTDENG